MTPADRDVIAADAAVLSDRPDRFSTEFYATLFEVDPELRPLFPAALDEQREKLFAELGVLVERAVAGDVEHTIDDLIDRARALGRRHEVYGVEPAMYGTVEIALLAALHATIADFDDVHRDAWRRLYRLVATAMLEP